MIDPAIKWMFQAMATCAAILFLVFWMLSCMGCVSTYVKTDKWECRRIAVGYNAKMPALKMSPAGTIVLSNYGGEVDEEMLATVQKALLLLGVK